MEKKWICSFGLFSAGLLGLFVCGSLQAQAPSASGRVNAVEISFEVPIENGNLNAARDKAQGLAFEKAMELSLPAELSAEIRQQRIKAAPRFVKSFRVLEEKNVGESLHFRYQVEFQPAAYEGISVQLGPPPSASKDWHVEIVSTQAFNAGQLIDQLEKDAGIKVTSFKLTRSALILEVSSHKLMENLKADVQAVVGSIGTVGLFEKPAATLQPVVQDSAPGALQPPSTGSESSQVPVEHPKDELKKD